VPSELLISAAIVASGVRKESPAKMDRTQTSHCELVQLLDATGVGSCGELQVAVNKILAWREKD
jgi:hypothetical protein